MPKACYPGSTNSWRHSHSGVRKHSPGVNSLQQTKTGRKVSPTISLSHYSGRGAKGSPALIRPAKRSSGAVEVLHRWDEWGRQNATQEHLLVQVCPGFVCCQSDGEALKISQILIGRRTPEMEFTGWGRTEVGMGMGSRGE